MELLLILFFAYIFYEFVIVFIKNASRKSIIKKYYNNIGEEVLNGLRDEELIEWSEKGDFSAYGLSMAFRNEAASDALDEIKRKGLARSEEKQGIWLTGETRLSEEKILSEKVAVRCKEIGIKYLE
jgi:hypothetical protein